MTIAALACYVSSFKTRLESDILEHTNILIRLFVRVSLLVASLKLLQSLKTGLVLVVN